MLDPEGPWEWGLSVLGPWGHFACSPGTSGAWDLAFWVCASERAAWLHARLGFGPILIFQACEAVMCMWG